MKTAPLNSVTTLPQEAGFSSFWYRAQDGLKLHARIYGADASADVLPVICLPGLARTAADFHEVALELSAGRGRARKVISVDYRGRGLSARDPNPVNYDIAIEMQDVLDLMTAVGVAHAVFVGTSRGGLITMAMSAVRPGAIKGVVLNDIGPVIEGKGLARIKGYVGKLPKPRDWTEAVALMKRLASQHFTRLTDADWRLFAERTFVETPQGLQANYDPALMKSLENIDIEKKLPTLWPYFAGLSDVPVLSIRGENSDLFSAETQAEMARRHRRLESYVVTGEGHAPLLTGRAEVQKIASFVRGIG
jgi:pimeloyl-ACP methyl ester carboxylesterase